MAIKTARLCGLILCLLISIPAYSDETAPTILIFGDSLSAAYNMRQEQGWVHLLTEKLSSGDYPHQVVNASISGETTYGGLQRLPELLAAHQPSWVLLELGANDGLRGLPLNKMRANFRQMISLAQTAQARVLLLGIRIPSNYGPVYTRRFLAIYQELAMEYDLPWIPFFLEGLQQGNDLAEIYLQEDGLHPNAAAQALIVETVWRHLQPLLMKSK